MHLLFVPGIVLDFGIDGNLHVESTVGVVWDNMAVVVGIFTLGVKDTALAVTVNLGTLFADLANGVGLVRMRVDVEDGVGGLGGVRASGAGGSSRGVGSRVGSREGTASDE